MKQKLFASSLVLCAALAMTGCQNEESLLQQQDGQISVQAVMGSGSRTAVDLNGKVTWTEGDAMLVYGNNVQGTLTLAEGEGTTLGTFRGTVAGDADNLVWAVYPNEKVALNGNKVTLDLSQMDAAKSNAPMIAGYGKGTLQFSHLSGMVRITINDVPADIKTMTVTGEGIAQATLVDGVITNTTGSQTVTVNGLVEGRNELYIPVLTSNKVTAGTTKLTFTLGEVSKELELPLKVGALTKKDIPVFTYTEEGLVELENSVTTLAGLQAAIDAAQTGETTTIVLGDNITGDVTITQKENVNIIIDGDSHTFTGVMTTFGNGRQSGVETLAIKNINFVAKTGAEECILSPDKSVNNLYSYSHNVTVENCTFTDEDGTVNCAAIRHEDGGDKNWTVTNCKVDNTMHSLLQINNVAGKLTVAGCTVESKNGINLNCCTNVEVSGCDFDVTGYAVRFGVSSGGNLGETKTFAISESTLKSACNDGDAIIMFRASAVDATLTLTDVTFDGTTEISGNTEATTIIIDGAVQKSASTQDALSKAISAGDNVKVTLEAGTYTLPSTAAGKTLIISGTEDTKISVTNGLTNINGANVTFDGVTILSKPDGLGYNNGFSHAEYVVYNDCVIEGTLGLMTSCEFNNCEFKIEGNYYNVWTWGAGTATFNGCTFNCDGKALLVYANVLDNGTKHQTVNITGCTFNDNGDDTVTGKAAIEITNTYTPIRTYDVIIKETKVNGFAQTVPGSDDFNAAYGSVAGSNIGTNVWGNKCELPNTQINVVIDGVDVY